MTLLAWSTTVIPVTTGLMIVSVYVPAAECVSVKVFDPEERANCVPSDASIVVVKETALLLFNFAVTVPVGNVVLIFSDVAVPKVIALYENVPPVNEGESVIAAPFWSVIAAVCMDGLITVMTYDPSMLWVSVNVLPPGTSAKLVVFAFSVSDVKLCVGLVPVAAVTVPCTNVAVILRDVAEPAVVVV